MTIPIVVALAFAIDGGRSGGAAAGTPAPSSSASARSGPLGPVRATAPTMNPETAATCNPVVAAMPANLAGRPERAVQPGGPAVRAWGDPAVVLTCGVSRPAQLHTGSSYQAISLGGLNQPQVGWMPIPAGPITTWTSVDRSVYFTVQAPTGDSGPIRAISAIIAQRLPAVCKVTPDVGDPPSTVYCSERP